MQVLSHDLGLEERLEIEDIGSILFEGDYSFDPDRLVIEEAPSFEATHNMSVSLFNNLDELMCKFFYCPVLSDY